MPPLTYLSGGVAGGAVSTLEVRVNDVLWHEVPSLLKRGPRERVYLTRLADDGSTSVQFGDGVTGARLPTGVENVRATYRRGSGLGGQVAANQLTQLVSRPLGVKGMRNPLAAAGGADPETLAGARQNAPLPILTLGRIVSLQDYADFARAFAGIGKALATWTWVAPWRHVVLTVAGSNGEIIDPASPVYGSLLPAIRAAGDPNVAVTVISFVRTFFQLAGYVQVAADYEPARVLPAVEAALRAARSQPATSGSPWPRAQ